MEEYSGNTYKYMLYRIKPKINDLELTIDIVDTKGRITNFFINDIGNGFFLNHTNIKINSNKYDKEKISETDFLGKSLGIPIFSKHAKEILENILSDEIAFFESELNLTSEKCFSGKILKKIKLIDENNSRFRISSTGSKFLMKPILLETITTDFYIAKDEKFPTYFYVSEKFIKLIQENNLKIEFDSI